MTPETQNSDGRLLRNAFHAGIAWFVPLVVSFVSTPIIVYGLGIEAYGLYALILGVISYSFTIGIGRVATKAVAEYRLSGDTEKVNSTVSATIILSLSLGSGGAIVIALLAPLIVTNIFQIPASSQQTVLNALYVACTTIVVLLISLVFQSVLQGLHRFDRYSLLTNLSSVLMQCGNIALVFLERGILELVVWNLFVVTLMAAVFYLSAKKLMPDLRIHFRIKKEIFYAAIRYGSALMLYQVFGNSLHLFERGWVTRSLGAESLTYYLVPMTLAINIYGLILSLTTTSFPTIVGLKNDREKLAAFYMRTTKLIVALIVLIAASLIIVGKPLLSLWLSPEFAVRAYPVLVIHTITFSLMAVFLVASQVAEAFSFAALFAGVSFIWTATAIPLMIAFAGNSNIEGVAFARMIGVVTTLPAILFIEKRYLGRALVRFWFGFLVKLGLAVGAIALIQTQFFARYDDWRLILLGLAASIGAYCLVLSITGVVTKDDRKMVTNLIFRRGQPPETPK